MTLLMGLVLLMLGACLGVFVASLMMMARAADDAMAQVWDDDEEDT